MFIKFVKAQQIYTLHHKRHNLAYQVRVEELIVMEVTFTETGLKK